MRLSANREARVESNVDEAQARERFVLHMNVNPLVSAFQNLGYRTVAKEIWRHQTRGMDENAPPFSTCELFTQIELRLDKRGDILFCSYHFRHAGAGPCQPTARNRNTRGKWGRQDLWAFLAFATVRLLEMNRTPRSRCTRDDHRRDKLLNPRIRESCGR